jgi:hypothetical protein
MERLHNVIFVILCSITGVIMLCLLIVIIGYGGTTHKNTTRFKQISSYNVKDFTMLVYDVNTKIVYLKCDEDEVSYTPYISNDGLPYRYNEETKKMESIK